MTNLTISKLLVKTRTVCVYNLGLDEEVAILRRQAPGLWSYLIIGDHGLMLVDTVGESPRRCALLKSFGRINFIFTKSGVKERTVEMVAELSGESEAGVKKLLASRGGDITLPIQTPTQKGQL